MDWEFRWSGSLFKGHKEIWDESLIVNHSEKVGIRSQT